MFGAPGNTAGGCESSTPFTTSPWATVTRWDGKTSTCRICIPVWYVMVLISMSVSGGRPFPPPYSGIYIFWICISFDQFVGVVLLTEGTRARQVRKPQRFWHLSNDLNHLVRKMLRFLRAIKRRVVYDTGVPSTLSVFHFRHLTYCWTAVGHRISSLFNGNQALCWRYMPSSEEDRFEELDKMKGDQKDIFKSVLDRADSPDPAVAYGMRYKRNKAPSNRSRSGWGCCCAQSLILPSLDISLKLTSLRTNC